MRNHCALTDYLKSLLVPYDHERSSGLKLMAKGNLGTFWERTVGVGTVKINLYKKNNVC